VPTAIPKSVLFLGTGNQNRSRFAEMVFNSVAGKMRLPGRAKSRGLAVERGVDNVGPMAAPAVKALEVLRIQAPNDVARTPAAAMAEDFGGANWIVALNEVEHRPLLEELFPAWVEKVEFWQVADVPQAMSDIEREVMDLAARLIVGGRRRVVAEVLPAPSQPTAAKAPPAGKALTARVGRETAGRRGKGVTTVFDLALSESALKELAGMLKQRCGTGGTVKNGRIEIQGEQRERIVSELERLGYRVKRVGGS